MFLASQPAERSSGASSAPCSGSEGYPYLYPVVRSPRMATVPSWEHGVFMMDEQGVRIQGIRFVPGDLYQDLYDHGRAAPAAMFRIVHVFRESPHGSYSIAGARRCHDLRKGTLHPFQASYRGALYAPSGLITSPVGGRMCVRDTTHTHNTGFIVPGISGGVRIPRGRAGERGRLAGDSVTLSPALVLFYLSLTYWLT